MSLQVHHTIRHANSWDPFGDIGQQVEFGDSGAFALSAAGDGSNLHLLLAATSGELLSTVRQPDRWLPVERQSAQAQAAELTTLRTCMVEGNLHACFLTRGPRNLWHTIRMEGVWHSAGSVSDQVGDQREMISIGAAIVDGLFHLCALTKNRELVYTIRFGDRWQAFETIETSVRFNQVATTSDGASLHLFAIADDGSLWHTIRSGGRWSPFGNVSLVVGSPGQFQRVSAAAINGDIHVMATTRNPLPQGLWHTIRRATARWEPWGDATLQTGPLRPLFQDYVHDLSATAVGGELHTCVLLASPPF